MKQQDKIAIIPPVWFFSLISSARIYLRKLYYKMVPANVAVFEMAEKFWLAKAISVACQLNLAEIIADAECAVEEIAKASETDQQALYRLMRALAGEGIFKETRFGHFRNNSFSNALRDSGNSVKYMVMHQLNETNWDIVNQMKKGVVTGNNVAQYVLKTDIFTHLGNTPDKNELYNKAMSETSRLSGGVFVAAYNFKNIDVLADIGGGEGTLLFNILRKHKHIKGVLFDLPHVVQTAGRMAEKLGVDDRVEIIPGNFFEDAIPAADAYLLKNVLHVFNDETCIRLLQSIGRSMQGNGKVLLVETVIRSDNKPAFGKILDLQMLLASEDGKERSEAEFKRLFEAAGFRLKRVVRTISPFSIIEGQKTN